MKYFFKNILFFEMSALRSSQARTNRRPTIQSRKTISIKQWYKLSQNLLCLSFVVFQELQPHHRGGKGSTTPTWNSSLIMRCDEAFKQWQQVLKWYLSNPFLTQNIIVTLCSVFKLGQIELERSATWICTPCLWVGEVAWLRGEAKDGTEEKLFFVAEM